MPLDFDPIYHTETMVRILREQGSPQLAMELAEIILQRDPQNSAVTAILHELKAEARLAFERFKNSGRPEGGREVTVPETVEALEMPQGIETSEAPQVPEEVLLPKTPDLTLVQGGLPSVPKGKIARLQQLLARIQKRRGSHETVQA